MPESRELPVTVQGFGYEKPTVCHVAPLACAFFDIPGSDEEDAGHARYTSYALVDLECS